MFGNLSGPTLLVILFIVLLLFGAPKLPGLAKSLGQSMKILKKEVRGDGADSESAAPAAQAPAAPAAQQAAPANPETPAAPVTPAAPADPASNDTASAPSADPDKQ